VREQSEGTESPSSVDQVATTGDSVEPEFDSSPDVNLDGSVADSTDTKDHEINSLGTSRRFYYKIRGLIIAPLGLVREWLIPIVVFFVVFGIGGYLLLNGMPF
jgi:hypothetical protein